MVFARLSRIARRPAARRARPSPCLGLALALAALLAPRAGAHSPHDVVSELALSPNYASDRTLLAAVLLSDISFLARSTNGGRSWQLYGSPVLDSSIEAMQFSPDYANDGVVLIATKSKGVWRSTDGGLTFQQSSIGLVSQVVNDIAISPDAATTGIVLAATQAGLYRSTDLGQSWTPVTAGLVDVTLTSVAFGPKVPHETPVAFAAGKTVHRSVNGGFTWSAQATWSDQVDTLAISPQYVADQMLAIGFGRHGGGVQVSTTGGASWTPSSTGLTDLYVYELVIAPDGTTFASTKTSGCYRAASPFGPWTLQVSGLEENSDLTTIHWTDLALSPDYLNDQTVFLGAYEGLFKTQNAATTWRQQDLYNQRYNRHVAFSPGWATDKLAFIGNYGGGVLRWKDLPVMSPISPASGGTSTPARGGSGLSGSAPSSMATPGNLGQPTVPSDSQHVLEPRADNLNSLWSDALVLSPDFVNDRTIYYGFFGLYRSVNAGKNWSAVTLPAAAKIVRAIALSPNFATDSFLVVGTNAQGTYRSFNGGLTWLDAGTGLPTSTTTSRIVASPAFATDQRLYMSTRNFGIYVSNDAGQSWTQTSALSIDPHVHEVYLSPNYLVDGTLFGVTQTKGVIRSTDFGATWATSNGGLDGTAQITAMSLAFSPQFAVDGTVFITTRNEGVRRSTDFGATWQPVGPGLPLSSPRAVRVAPNFPADPTVVVTGYDWIHVSRDAGASWTPLPGLLRVDDGHPSVTRTGLWAKAGNPANFAGSYDHASVAGASIEFPFNGRTLSWYGNRGPGNGIATLQIDDEPPVSIDLYSANASVQQLLHHRVFPKVGWHVVKITHSGTANPASSGLRVESDGFLYTF